MDLAFSWNCRILEQQGIYLKEEDLVQMPHFVDEQTDV